MADRINNFAEVVRKHGGRVLHCPSETVDTYYKDWPQRLDMKKYPQANAIVSQEMRQADIPLDTSLTMGCPDTPECTVELSAWTKQHENIEILPQDLISDSGQEIYNFIIAEGIEYVLISGVALNMCVVARPFGVVSLVELGVSVQVVADLVEVFYNPSEQPYITVEQAKWLTLGYIEGKWCPVTTCSKETAGREKKANDLRRKENNVRIHTNFPGQLVARLKQAHQLEYFVETGTAHGDTAELAAIAFDRVWSCDIDPRLVNQSKERLSSYSNVTLSVESSPDFLRRIKPELTKPTLYWLDAHWCGGRVKPAKECPLIEEIEAIGSFNGHSVILIDDINLIQSPPPPPHNPNHWPMMRDLGMALSRWGEPYRFDWHQGSSSKVLIVQCEVGSIVI